MYRTFKISYNSGTYATTLEAYGVANLLSAINDTKVNIFDKGTYYEVLIDEPITEEMINNLVIFKL